MNIYQVLRHRNKGTGNEVHVVFNAEGDVRFILLGKILLLEVFAGEAHALAAGHDAAVNDLGLDAYSVGRQDPEFQKGIVDQNGIAGFHFLCEITVADGNLMLVSLHFLGGKGKMISVVYGDAAVFKGADAVFRAFGIQHDRDRQIQLCADFFDGIDTDKVFRMGAVRKVQTRYVHTCPAELYQHLLGFAGRSNGTDDLCLTHGKSPLRCL